MRPKRVLAIVAIALAGAIASPVVVHAQGEVSVVIARFAQLTLDGAVLIRVHIACDPLPGVLDFQEAHLGAAQARTGAEAEGGIDGTIVCDGLARTHTARLPSFTGNPFRRGPATANVVLLICHVVGDEQVCEQGASATRIVIRGRSIP
jgi:hypothetical protein